MRLRKNIEVLFKKNMTPRQALNMMKAWRTWYNLIMNLSAIEGSFYKGITRFLKLLRY